MLSLLGMRRARADAMVVDDLCADLSEFQTFLPPPTGWDRFKWIFVPNSYGFRSVEGRMISSAMFTTAVVGLAVGGLRSVRRSSERFMAANRLAVFQNPKDAKVSNQFDDKTERYRLVLQIRVRDQVVFTFWKEGIKMSTKMTFLVGTYT